MDPGMITTFRVREDGAVEMPPGGSELLFISMIHMPLSWTELAAVLSTLPPFAQNLDVHNLVYAFCVALVTRDPVLMDIIEYDPVTHRLALPPAFRAAYAGQPSPLQFWESHEGLLMKNVVSTFLSVNEEDNPTFAEFLAGRDIWLRFCEMVDDHCSEIHSVSNFQSPWRISEIDFTFRASTGSSMIRCDGLSSR